MQDNHDKPPPRDDLSERKGKGNARLGMSAINAKRGATKQIEWADDQVEGLVFDADGIPELAEFPIDEVLVGKPDAHDYFVDGKPTKGEGSGVRDATIVTFGKRRTGKSFLTLDIMNRMKAHYPRGVAFSATDKLNHTYDQVMPSKYIFEGMNTAILQAYMDYQFELLQDPDREEKEKRQPEYNRAFVVFDDVIQDIHAVRNSKPLFEIFSAGRHFKTLMIFNTQYPKALTPAMREVRSGYCARSASG